ncbi:unnamed protein product [Prorocentrum cordatum]|uniref:Uncharacterized protein n=1 Tax=Prorocentrum cordatum TaxID=2364126 RepID=A0ABN9SIB1_9DINO|nr:unnamed protein product [Polarella glacialis]
MEEDGEEEEERRSGRGSQNQGRLGWRRALGGAGHLRLLQAGGVREGGGARVPQPLLGTTLACILGSAASMGTFSSSPTSPTDPGPSPRSTSSSGTVGTGAGGSPPR